MGTPDTASFLEASDDIWHEERLVGIPGDRDRSFRRIVTDDSGLS